MSVVEEVLLRNFKELDPITASKMVHYEMPDKFSLLVTLDNGRKLLYDDLTDSTRYLHPDPNNMSDEELMTEFCYRLKHMMTIRGYNQLRLSEETGISNTTINKYLTGQTVPSILKVMRIARVLKCSLDELWYT